MATTRVVRLAALVPIQAAVASPRHFKITEVSESCCRNKRVVAASVPVQTEFATLIGGEEELPPQAVRSATTVVAKVKNLIFI